MPRRDESSVLVVDRVHRELRDRLLQGEFHLADRLAEVRVAEMFGVSRTPIREAFRRLEAEELLASTTGGGYRPAVPDLDRIAHLYEVRIRLEALSIERAADDDADRDALHMLKERWTTLGAQIDDIDPGDFVYTEESFHLDIARAGSNTALSSVLSDVNQRIRIVRVQDFFVTGRIAKTIEEHLAIVSSVLDGSLAQAVELMERHISDSARKVRDRALSVIARMSSTRPAAAEHASYVVASSGVGTRASDHDRSQRRVGLAVATAVEPVAGHLP